MTSEVYHTQNYWKGFFCSVCGAFTFRALGYFGKSRGKNIVSLITTNFDPVPYAFAELPLFCLLAAACGFGGGVFVKAFAWTGKRIEDFRTTAVSGTLRYAAHPAVIAGIVALSFSTLQYPLGEYARVDMKTALNELVSEDTLTAQARNGLLVNLDGAPMQGLDSFFHSLHLDALSFCLHVCPQT